MKDKMAAMKSDFSGIGADETFAQSQPEIMENFLDWIDNTWVHKVHGYFIFRSSHNLSLVVVSQGHKQGQQWNKPGHSILKVTNKVSQWNKPGHIILKVTNKFNQWNKPGHIVIEVAGEFRRWNGLGCVILEVANEVN